MMLTFPCVSVQRINHLAIQLVVFPELFALRGVLHVLHLGVQRPRRGKQKLQCVSMWYNVSSCTLKSIETHYILRFGDIMIDGPFGGPAVPGLDVRDLALAFSVPATPNLSVRLTLSNLPVAFSVTSTSRINNITKQVTCRPEGAVGKEVPTGCRVAINRSWALVLPVA